MRYNTPQSLPTRTIVMLLSICGCALIALHRSARAQEPDPPAAWKILSAEDLEPWPEETRAVADLPAAPPEIHRLIEQGDVEIVVYDAARFSRRYQGETQLKMWYQTQSRFRWRMLQGLAGKRTLVIYPRVKGVQLFRSHKMLLPEGKVGPQMYDDALVRHEFDHVRISTDPRFDKMFQSWIQQQVRVIRVNLEPSDTDINAIAEREIQSRIQSLFDDLLELVQIRYRELDQVTRHGRQPLPAEFFNAED